MGDLETPPYFMSLCAPFNLIDLCLIPPLYNGEGHTSRGVLILCHDMSSVRKSTFFPQNLGCLGSNIENSASASFRNEGLRNRVV